MQETIQDSIGGGQRTRNDRAGLHLTQDPEAGCGPRFDDACF
jgi:hypothetical protein